jgi:Fe-Mn family superoxide dismutase
MSLRRFTTSGPAPTKVTLPELKYNYSALEPILSTKLLELHHKKHHQTYVNNLNAALEQFEGTPLINSEAKNAFDYNKMATLTQTIKFNLGGHINHSIYWENLAPIGQGGGEFPNEASPLTKQVKEQYGSYEELIKEFTAKTVPIQGSGWGWLGYDLISRNLRLLELANQ